MVLLIIASVFYLYVISPRIGVYATSLALDVEGHYDCCKLQGSETGYDVAKALLRSKKMSDVGVYKGDVDSNAFEFETKSITLEPENYYSNSVTAAATAAHEVAHAYQYIKCPILGILIWLTWKSSLLTAKIFGVLTFVAVYSDEPKLKMAGIIMYAWMLFTRVLSFCREADASRLAIKWLKKANYIETDEEVKGVRKVLFFDLMTHFVSLVHAFAFFGCMFYGIYLSTLISK